MKMPMLEPADSQECKDFTKRAFELSEQFDTPFMLRTTVRVNHGSSIVTLENRVEVPVKHYERDIMKNTNIPALARNKHKTVEERLVRLQEFSNETDLNRVELHDTRIGVICAGICYQYAREVFGDGASYLKLGFTYPMPDRKIREFAAQVDKLYVLEELDPFIEDYVRGLGIECTGKAVLPLYLEYSADIIRRALGLPGVSAAYEAPVQAPVRPASFCAGCPHRGIYHEISKYNGKIVFDGVVESAKTALANGIPVALGNDVGCPYITQYDFWRELCYFHKYCGVSNQFALYTATLRNAQLAGVGDVTGSIEPGKSADFIVTKHNPLEDLRALQHLELVVCRGHVIKKPNPKRNKTVDALLDPYLE